MAEELSIKERFDILVEAIEFYEDLSSAGELNEKLWRIKATALSTVEECLALYQRKILEDAERTEETLKEWIAISIDEDYINTMIEKKWMSDEDADFYKGWFGLAIWILFGDKEQIDWLRNLEKEYSRIEDLNANAKTIEDLVK